MFLKNKNIIFKIRRSKVTDYAALSLYLAHKVSASITYCFFIGCADPPLLSNGVRVVSNDGFQANYTCNLGYSLKGLQTRHCLLATSEWENVDPECGK